MYAYVLMCNYCLIHSKIDHLTVNVNHGLCKSLGAKSELSNIPVCH